MIVRGPAGRVSTLSGADGFGTGRLMPKNLQADAEWHRARIAFYQQAMAELDAAPDAPNIAARREGLRTIIADLQHTLADLEKVLGQIPGN